MSNDDLYKKIICQNLKKFMALNNKTQSDLINDLGFDKSAVSTWCNGTRLPRMDKVNTLAKYFNINRSDLIEDNPHKATPDSNIKIMEIYNQLNALGKQEAEKRVQELTYIPKYTTPDDHLILQAAHERTDIEVTDEMRKHDDDIMNDENF